ncbi:MAG: hypothetical protein R3286_12735, partial [Gammaproteobacteria bacterium]|nr:hypothetical protein [Gammaproteobacteria bacterium]
RLSLVDAALDPALDLHTVVDARDTVITVPPRKPGFFAALTGAGAATPTPAPEAGPETAREAEEAARLEREIDEGARRGAAAEESAAAAAPAPIATPGALEGIQQVEPEQLQGTSNIGRDVERDVGDVERELDMKPATETPAAPAPPATEAGTGERAITPTETYAPNVAGATRESGGAAAGGESSTAASEDDKSFLEQLFQGYGTREPGSPQPVRD